MQVFANLHAPFLNGWIYLLGHLDLSVEKKRTSFKLGNICKAFCTLTANFEPMLFC